MSVKIPKKTSVKTIRESQLKESNLHMYIDIFLLIFHRFVVVSSVSMSEGQSTVFFSCHSFQN